MKIKIFVEVSVIANKSLEFPNSKINLENKQSMITFNYTPCLNCTFRPGKAQIKHAQKSQA